MSPDSRPLGLGVAGCGNLSYWTHLPLAQRLRGARLVGAADPDADARRRAATRAKVPIVADLDDLLAMESVEAVLIVTPTHLHASTAVRCLEAGKHVYIEKPLASTSEDADRVRAAAQRSDRVLRVGFNRRLHPAFEQAKRAILDGRIGTVRSVTTRFCEPSVTADMAAWRRRRESGGGTLFDLASHHVDLVRWLLNDEIADVNAHIRSEESDHDEAWLELRTRKGVVATGFYSFRAGRSDTMDIVGSRATIRIDRHRTGARVQTSRRLGYGVRNTGLPTTRAIWQWRLARLVRPSLESSYRRSLQQFVAECQGHSERLLADVDDGRRNLEVLLAAETAAQNDRRVELPPT